MCNERVKIMAKLEVSESIVIDKHGTPFTWVGNKGLIGLKK
jgi:hypothetical protein